MTSQWIKVEGFHVHLKDGDVWKWLSGSRPHISALEEEVTKRRLQGQALSRPRGIYQRLEVKNMTPGGVLLAGDVRLEGTNLGEFFQGAKEAVCIVATIGPSLEEQVATFFAEGRSIEAFVLDAVGSAAATSAVRYVAGLVCQQVKEQGWQTGPPLRPGQNYWDITGQRAIFQALPTQHIGVHLLDSCFMSPQKSQSAVIPLGLRLKVQEDPAEQYCRYCSAKRCPTRVAY